MAVSLVLGLGNPGPRFESTRHNVGFAALDTLVEQMGLRFSKPFFLRYRIARYSSGPQGPVAFVQPLTYMNRSGQVLPRLRARYGQSPEKLLVVCDNLDLEPGRVRLKRGGGTAGHNGLKSIVSHLESTEFYRLYIGIGRPKHGVSVVDHVLGQPTGQDAEILNNACTRAAAVISELLSGDIERVMNECNRRSG